MNDQVPNWWQVVQLPIAGTAGASLLGLVTFLLGRADKRRSEQAASSMTTAERRDAALVAERAALTVEQRDFVERIETERDAAKADASREKAERIIAEAEARRAWKRAWFWYRLAHDLYHALLNARQVAAALAGRVMPPDKVPTWQEFQVPVDLEDTAQ